MRAPRHWLVCVGLLVWSVSGGCGDSAVDADAAAPDAAVVDAEPGPDAADASLPPDAEPPDAGPPPWTGVPYDRPLRLLFLGNSFTAGGPIPHLVRDVASSVGWPAPEVDYNAPGGETLSGHRTRPESLALVDAGDWDFVVLQEYSTKATDNAGDPAEFKADATWFYDRIKAASPEAQVVLYETWARHPDHSIYPGTFADPAEMQAQIRFHYNDAADSYIPANALFVPTDHVRVAPCGDAWEHHLAQPGALRLHAADDYHAGANGQYLNALVIYSTIYGVVATGAGALSLTPADATALQQDADTTTGATQLPPAFPVPPFDVGQSLRVDFGTLPTTDPGWTHLLDCLGGGAHDVADTTGAVTGVDLLITDAFTGANEMGLAANTLGYPASVSQDVCWTGSFDGHAAALPETAALVLEDLADGLYELRLFASRSGDDGGLGRLTRYTVDGQTLDLEISDNVGDEAVFLGVSPDASNRLVIHVAVSPAGTGRFAYLGALELTKTSE